MNGTPTPTADPSPRAAPVLVTFWVLERLEAEEDLAWGALGPGLASPGGTQSQPGKPRGHSEPARPAQGALRASLASLAVGAQTWPCEPGGWCWGGVFRTDPLSLANRSVFSHRKPTQTPHTHRLCRPGPQPIQAPMGSAPMGPGFCYPKAQYRVKVGFLGGRVSERSHRGGRLGPSLLPP